jgi:hypothetical protein
MKQLYSVLVALTLALPCTAVLAEEEEVPPFSSSSTDVEPKPPSGKLTIEEKKQIAEAESLERALAKDKADHAPATECLEAIRKLGDAYCNLRDYKKAESFLRTNIAEYDRAPDNQTYEYAECLGQISYALDHQKRFADALEVRRKQADIELKILDDWDYRKGEMYHDLAYSQLKANDSDGAYTSLKKTLSILEKLPPQQSPFCLIQSYAMLAEIEADKNERKAAIRDCKTCVRLADLLRGVYRPENDGFYFRMINVLEKCCAKQEAARLEHRRYMIGAVMRMVGKPVGKTPKRPHWEYEYLDDDKITIDVILNPKPSI